MFTIIIPFYEGHEYIDRLISSIPNDIQTIIVDDMSSQPLYDKYASNVRVIRLESKGYFAGAVNKGIESCDTDVLVLNQDVRFTGNKWIDLIDTELGMMGERIKGDRDDWGEAGYIHGTFMWLSRIAIIDAGLLNQELYPLWGCTADLQRRISRKGYRVKPVKVIPDFIHERTGQFGSSIDKTLRSDPNTRLLSIPPEISIIIPCYNFGKYLGDAINSLIGGDTVLGYHPGQTFQSFEVIIVDDGSKDNSPAIINEIVGNGEKGIRAFRTNRTPIDSKNKYIGKPTALNAGINMAKGKYITVLDADDMMEPTRLEKLYYKAEANPGSVIYDDIVLFRNGERMPIIDGKRWGVMEDYDFDSLITKNHMHIGIFYEKKAWDAVSGYNKQMKYGREDWCFNIALGQAGYCGVHINEQLYLYRREGQNRTLVNTTPAWHNRFLNTLKGIYPNIYKGERTDMCCGKDKDTNTNTKEALFKSASYPGQDGMVTLIYRGSRVAGFNDYGFETGTRYRILPKRPFYADSRDLYSNSRTNQGLLEKMETGSNTPMYIIYNDDKQTKAVKTVEPELAVKTVDSGFGTEIQSTEVPKLSVEPLLTITKLRSYLRSNSEDTDYLKQLLAYELSTKNRTGAVGMLESAIG